jgi:hypothetical protein
MSKLDLRSRESILAGGERGAAIVPGDAKKSLLFRLAAGLEQPSMPPGKKLSPADLETIRQWIDAGAAMTAETKPVEDPKTALAKLEERPVTDEERKFWSFQPVRRPETPAGVHPVDYFLRAAWSSKGLQPSAKADKRVLVRRAYLDLLGVPPSTDEVRSFVSDTSADAWPKLVDKLLASPLYGERWARHWLDVVRYADSGGYEFDRDRANAWRYRDYVIRAFNEDKAYNRFVLEQIAGDEIAPDSQEAVVATGFLRLGPEANIKTEQTRMDELDDILATTGGAFLGMTLGCARCHNHKFDPIPQKDYYRMQAVFFPSQYLDTPLANAAEIAKNKEAVKAIDDQVAPLKSSLESLEKPYRERILQEKKNRLPDYIQLALKTPPERRTEGQKLNAEQVEKTLGVKPDELEAAMSPADRDTACELRSEIQVLQWKKPVLPMAMAVAEKGPKPEPSYFLHHGSVGQKGSSMRPGVLTVASLKEPEFMEPPEGAKTSGRRRVFAEWIASPENPLTARVMINRIWQHHFGEGLVRTPNNFGKTGDAPTHPALLDWLASEFVSRNWSMKAMHRLLLTSDAYQMASVDVAANRAIDPENRYVWRMPRRRMESEALRDSILAAAGTLNAKAGGPGVYPFIDPALWASSSGRHWPGKPEDDPETWRRSIYVFSKRSIPVPMLEVFDKPDSIGSCARRNRSTIAPQALILMNSAFSLFHAQKFAARLDSEAHGDPGRIVERAFEIALSRPPSKSELSAAKEFLAGNPVADFCQTVFNLNEFAYIE